jgi:hypothetical protein
MWQEFTVLMAMYLSWMILRSDEEGDGLLCFFGFRRIGVVIHPILQHPQVSPSISNFAHLLSIGLG